MTRLVVIDTKANTYRVFENDKCLAEFVPEPITETLDLEQIEEIRTANYATA
jgi:hypothetical protein